jgi:RNA polymerase sigma-70 factor (ECF subfamily)|tara:strand:+ start:721 stop:1449 length:729 start_codon:yes stop_codon:yes gene_type:complete
MATSQELEVTAYRQAEAVTIGSLSSGTATCLLLPIAVGQTIHGHDATYLSGQVRNSLMFGQKSDEQLIKEAIAGVERAWLALIRRYEKRLYNYALRMTGNPDDALDMLQEVLLAVYRNLSTFRGDGPFPAWLFRIATFRCTDFLRRRRVNMGGTEEVEMLEDQQAHYRPDAVASGSEQNRMVLSSLATLPRDQRIVVELKFFQHFTFDEIAGQLGISSNTAKTRLYTALRKMRKVKEVSLAV